MVICTMTHSKIGCGRDADWKETKPIKRGREEKFLYYCDKHKREGVAYGWLVEDELERIK